MREALSRPGFWSQVAPAFAYVALVFYGGSIPLPAPPFDAPSLSWDKLGHLVAFALMQFVWWRALRYELPNMAVRTQSLVAALVATLLGGTLELYQAALPHRSAELWDLVADVLGAALAAIWVATRYTGKRSLTASSNLTNE